MSGTFVCSGIGFSRDGDVLAIVLVRDSDQFALEVKSRSEAESLISNLRDMIDQCWPTPAVEVRPQRHYHVNGQTNMISGQQYRCSACGTLFDDDPDEGGTFDDQDPGARIERSENPKRKRDT